jgi:hypothetical protein
MTAAFHVLSYALACLLHGENISKLTLCFATRGFGAPAVRDQLIRFAVKVEAQFGSYIGPRIGTAQAVIAPPHRDLLHKASRAGGLVAQSTLATASA